ncbi:MAG: hypothetical protein ACJASQ_003057 [Crocinitomicaceae bacterium]
MLDNHKINEEWVLVRNNSLSIISTSTQILLSFKESGYFLKVMALIGRNTN